MPLEDAARTLFALRHVPLGLARELLTEVVEGDARLAWRGGAAVGLADPPGARTLLEQATYVVVDLETTGLRPGAAGICEIGAVRVRGLELAETFETLVNPRRPLPAPIAALTGIEPAALRGAPPAELAVRRFLDFAGDAVLVAHNARFDLGFLDVEVERLTGRRLAAPVVDTVWLARRLLEGRIARVGLASLAHFFGTSVRPCHRALADAQATAEILLALLGLAQERGACTVAEIVELSAPRARRLAGKRSLVAGAPAGPGVYLFRDRNEQVLYVGRARGLKQRLGSYFRTERQRPAVEAALGALARVEWRQLGSELEAALEELRLLRELRPPANARSLRPDRYLYLRRRGASFVVTETPTALGPIKSRRVAQQRGPSARGSRGGRHRRGAPGAAGASAAACRRSPLRGRGTPSGSADGARAGRQLARRARPASCARGLPARTRARAGVPARLLRHGRARRLVALGAAGLRGPRRDRSGARGSPEKRARDWPGGRRRAPARGLVPAPPAAGATGRSARGRADPGGLRTLRRTE